MAHLRSGAAALASLIREAEGVTTLGAAGLTRAGLSAVADCARRVTAESLGYPTTYAPPPGRVLYRPLYESRRVSVGVFEVGAAVTAPAPASSLLWGRQGGRSGDIGAGRGAPVYRGMPLHDHPGAVVSVALLGAGRVASFDVSQDAGAAGGAVASPQHPSLLPARRTGDALLAALAAAADAHTTELPVPPPTTTPTPPPPPHARRPLLSQRLWLTLPCEHAVHAIRAATADERAAAGLGEEKVGAGRGGGLVMLDVVLPVYEEDGEGEGEGDDGDAPLWQRGGGDVRELYRARLARRVVTYFRLHTAPPPDAVAAEAGSARDDDGGGAGSGEGASPDVFGGGGYGAPVSSEAASHVVWLQPLRGEPDGFRCMPHPGPPLDVMSYLAGALEEAEQLQG